jgi:hypothetical protein
MRQPVVKVNGDQLDASEWNQEPTQECGNAVLSTSQTFNSSDLTQLAKSMAIYAANGCYYNDTGTNTHYVLSAVSPMQAPISYQTGMKVTFIASNTNSGACDINVNSIGVKSIKQSMGTLDLVAGNIIANTFVELIYNSSGSGWFEFYGSSSISQQAGIPTGMRAAMEYHWNTPPAGWIPDMVGTIGNATSGASIRANSDCLALYTLWWTNLPYDPVVGGRGASALADFNNNKQLNVLTYAGRVLANGLTGSPMGTTAGASTVSLAATNNGPHGHTYTRNSDTKHQDGTASFDVYINLISDTTGTSGNGTAFSVMQPTLYTNCFIKL